MTGVWDLDLDFDRFRDHAWIFPEVFISLRSLKGKIGYVSVQLRKVVTRSVGRVAGWSGLKLKDQLSLSRSIM